MFRVPAVTLLGPGTVREANHYTELAKKRVIATALCIAATPSNWRPATPSARSWPLVTLAGAGREPGSAR